MPLKVLKPITWDNLGPDDNGYKYCLTTFQIQLVKKDKGKNMHCIGTNVLGTTKGRLEVEFENGKLEYESFERLK